MSYTLVQSQTHADFGSFGAGTPFQITALTSAVGSGNFVWGAFLASVLNTDTPTVTDDKGNTYNVTSWVVAGGGNGLIIYWLGNITNGPTIISCNNSIARANWIGLVEEWSSVNASTNPADVTPAAGNGQATPGTGTDAITSTGVTTVTNGVLLLGATCNTTSTTPLPSSGTGFTTGTTYNAAISAVALENKVQTTAGSGTVATFTEASAAPTVTYMLAVKPVSSVIVTSNDRIVFEDGDFLNSVFARDADRAIEYGDVITISE
jgi:hypothetical protein